MGYRLRGDGRPVGIGVGEYTGGGVGGIDVVATESSDFDDEDRRALGRTMASLGVDAVFNCTFRTCS